MGKDIEMKSNNMAILIIGFDGYNDLWGDFFTLFKKYWADCPYRIYLANNILEYEVPGVTTIHGGKEAEWSRKAQIACEIIEEDYICLLLEDFYLGDIVNSKTIADVLELMEEYNLRYYKLNTFSKINTPSYGKKKYLHIIPENLEYGISLQPGIWNKKFLKEKLGIENYNAWKFEIDRLLEERQGTKEPLKGCVYDERNILQIQHGVVQGKYLPEVIKYFNKRNYHLNQTQRGVMTFKENFIYKSKRLNWPVPVKRILKSLLRLFGAKFVTDVNA